MFFRYNLFAFLWVLLILLLGLAPGESMPATDIWDFINFDKAAHFTVFVVLSFLLIVGFSKQYTFRVLRYRAELFAVLTSFVYGLLIEVGQAFIPDRSLEMADLLANCLGALTGWVVFYLIYKA